LGSEVERMADLTFELHSPMTEEEWDIITDVDLDHTPSVIFHTKHGKDIEYVKVVRCKECIVQKICRFAQFLGNDGYCSQGERDDEVEK
jgi:hypothetical protein